MHYEWFWSSDGSSWVASTRAPTLDNLGELWETCDWSRPTWHRDELLESGASVESLTDGAN